MAGARVVVLDPLQLEVGHNEDPVRTVQVERDEHALQL